MVHFNDVLGVTASILIKSSDACIATPLDRNFSIIGGVA